MAGDRRSFFIALVSIWRMCSKRAMALLQHGGLHDFPVVQDGHRSGGLTRDDVLRGLATGGPRSRVADVMHANVETVGPHDMLDTARGRISAGGPSMAPVVEDGRLLGLLTVDAVAQFLALQVASAHSPA